MDSKDSKSSIHSSSSTASPSNNALGLVWSFGFNKDVINGVIHLGTEEVDAIFYIAAHTGVIHNYSSRTQWLLQGHCNPITAAQVSANKRWLVTADAGPESMMVVWDANSGTPIKSIPNPHPNGVMAVDMSPDAMFLVTLSYPSNGAGNSSKAGQGTSAPFSGDATGAGTNGQAGSSGELQSISIWEWTKPSHSRALHTSTIDPSAGVQRKVVFNPSDVRQLVSCSQKKTIFWSWAEGELRGYVPKMSRHDFGTTYGAFTGVCFLPGTTQALTSTAFGEVVLWDCVDGMLPIEDEDPETAALALHNSRKSAIKVLNLSESAIHHASTVSTGGDSYVVLAGEDGAVRFYDFKFRLEAWFEDIDAGPITSLSFTSYLPPADPAQRGQLSSFRAPDFVVGTGNALIIGMQSSAFELLDPASRRGTVIVQGTSEEISSVAAHPCQPNFVMLCYSGEVQLWDYDLKVLVTSRTFDAAKLRPQCAAFSPSGSILAIGFTNGSLKILDAGSLEDVYQTFRYTQSPLTQVTFSNNSKFIAAADSDCHVLLWQHTIQEVMPNEDGDEDEPGLEVEEMAELGRKQESWKYVGRHRSHEQPITGLAFGVLEDGRLSLVSIGEDKYLVEYDLEKSSVEAGVLLTDEPKLLEQSAIPTAIMWHPLLGDDFEDRVVTANDEHKLKQWNADQKSCRRTSLGPTFGGPMNRLLRIDHLYEDGHLAPTEFAAYSTHEKVVGLIMMPLDGNPHKAMGLIAHPGQISDVAVSGDGSFLFTAGGPDLTVNMWRINTDIIKAQAEASAGSIDSYVEQLEGGRDGALYEEMVDYFYYSQLRTQGEACTDERETSGSVPLVEVPNLMRALGFYPSQLEVNNMVSEVKYRHFTETGELEESISLDDFIRLFINHRPVFPVGKHQIEEAFQDLGCDPADGKLSWSELCIRLEQDGEKIDNAELGQCLEALLGVKSFSRVNGKASIHAGEFAEEVLGFEDYAEQEEQEAAAVEGA